MTEYHKIPSYKNAGWAQALENLSWIGQEKVDGMNIRVIWSNNERRFTGRTDNAVLPGDLVEVLEKLFPVITLQEVFPDRNIVFYGEGYGGKIQKMSAVYGEAKNFCLFDITSGGKFLHREAVADVAKTLGLEEPPYLFRGTISEAQAVVREGFTTHMGSQSGPAEGLILRPPVDLFDHRGNRVILKIRTKDQ